MKGLQIIISTKRDILIFQYDADARLMNPKKCCHSVRSYIRFLFCFVQNIISERTAPEKNPSLVLWLSSNECMHKTNPFLPAHRNIIRYSLAANSNMLEVSCVCCHLFHTNY